MINILLLLPIGLAAQQAGWEGGVTLGARGYQGELSRGIGPELDEIGGSYGLLLRRHLSPAWSLRLDANYSELSGSDLAAYENRNFSFESTYLQSSLVVEYGPWGKKRYPEPRTFQKRITPYFFAGFGWLQYEASAEFDMEEANGHQANIQADQVHPYPQQSLMLPFGAGLKADLSRSTVIGVELTTVTAFSDYLDGISQAGNPDADDWLPGASLVLSVRFLPKDTDRDGIADKEDACPQIKGVWSARGCPDQDLDGVEDLEDLCPEQAGSVELNGCPDTDKDGVADHEDSCPYKAGTLATRGCPDRDLDQIADHLDECPALPGPSWRGGCPVLDTDADGDLEDEASVCIMQPQVVSASLASQLDLWFGVLENVKGGNQDAIEDMKPVVPEEQQKAGFNF